MRVSPVTEAVGLDRGGRNRGTRAAAVIVAAVLGLLGLSQSHAAGFVEVESAMASPPPWAYPANPRDRQPFAEKEVPLRIPASSRTFLPSQLQDLFYAPDWHPNDHPGMPTVVARGRRPDVYACGYCHLPDGAGRPENASLAGLPAGYIEQQLADFKSGARGTALPQRAPPTYMIALSRAVTKAQIAAAAEFFSKLQPKTRIKVIEADTVPGTYDAGWFLAIDQSAHTEPIGRRIIEVPENLEQFERRDSHAGFLAFVPVGSVKAGAALVKGNGASRTLACAGCHGPDLRGLGLVPSIAGRSTSYIVRQLFDIQSGSRAGVAVAPMTAVVKQLRVEDMVAIAAYLATLN